MIVERARSDEGELRGGRGSWRGGKGVRGTSPPFDDDAEVGGGRGWAVQNGHGPYWIQERHRCISDPEQ